MGLKQVGISRKLSEAFVRRWTLMNLARPDGPERVYIARSNPSALCQVSAYSSAG